MGKKQATQGVKNLTIAKATIDADTGAVTYATPKKISDLQKISLSINTSVDKISMDDVIGDIIESFEGGQLVVNTYGIDNATLSEIEGREVDSNGIQISKSSDESPYYAIGWEAKKRDGNIRYIWLYLCKKVSDSEDYETKGQKINPKDSTLTFEISERIDEKWRAKVDSNDTNAPADLAIKWFTQVYDGTWPA